MSARTGGTTRADPRDTKIDLGVGVYKDADGKTPIMHAVKAAGKLLSETEVTKTYAGLAGEPDYHAAMAEMVLGAGYPADRLSALSTVGGTGACRQAFELAAMANPDCTIWVSDPTWPNHLSILKFMGQANKPYRYFDSETRSVCFDAMMDDLKAVKKGDRYVLNGEKIYVTSGERADAVVVWATLDKNLGRAAIKSFVVEHGTPGMTVTRLEKKLGIKASDTAAISFSDCRVPAANLLGNPEIDVQKGFAGVMETFDNTRPLVAGMAVGVAKASLDRTRELLKKVCKLDYRTPLLSVSHAEATLYRLEAEWEAARLLTMKAAWMADNKLPNSKEASIAKAKAGRVANEVTLKCVELAGALGYGEDELLEKWARDSKILDIFEGTQQIQLLIVARRLLGKSSSELK